VAGGKENASGSGTDLFAVPAMQARVAAARRGERWVCLAYGSSEHQRADHLAQCAQRLLPDQLIKDIFLHPVVSAMFIACHPAHLDAWCLRERGGVAGQ
jgi:hypothetical protein